MYCFDTNCASPADRELHGLRMCTPHYIEALEHSAHIVCLPMPVLIAKAVRWQELVLGPLHAALIERVRGKERIQERTGRPANFEAIEDFSPQNPRPSPARSAAGPAGSPDPEPGHGRAAKSETQTSLPGSSERKLSS